MNKNETIKRFLEIKLANGTISLDREKNLLRMRREAECFTYVDRGQLWHNRLTAEQQTELDTWYAAWLDVTETLLVPDKPIWLE